MPKLKWKSQINSNDHKVLLDFQILKSSFSHLQLQTKPSAAVEYNLIRRGRHPCQTYGMLKVHFLASRL